jgi:hypothetical protein
LIFLLISIMAVAFRWVLGPSTKSCIVTRRLENGMGEENGREKNPNHCRVACNCAICIGIRFKIVPALPENDLAKASLTTSRRYCSLQQERQKLVRSAKTSRGDRPTDLVSFLLFGMHKRVQCFFLDKTEYKSNFK